jgi:UDP-GlcNAc:undecaprenyl-phosphate GlcNAc-1-phosphate transferase
VIQDGRSVVARARAGRLVYDRRSRPGLQPIPAHLEHVISAGLSFLVAAAVAACLTPLVRHLALRKGVVEGADGGLKIHEGGVPRLGGIAVVLAFYAPVIGVIVTGAGITVWIGEDLRRFTAFALGGAATFALGLWDDVHGAGAKLKFGVEAAIAVAVWAAGFQVNSLRIPWVGEVQLGPWSLVVTVLWIVGITNALNLVDGLDGLAAGVALFAALAHVGLGMLYGDAMLSFFGAALAGAVVGFLPWNLPPARIFIGDSGALFLGYVLAVASLYGATHKASTAVAVLGPVLILGVPIMDTGLAIVRRTLRGASLFDGDREHVHHRALDAGLSRRRSLFLLWALSGAFALAGLVWTAASNRAGALALLSLLLMLAVFERRLGLLRKTAAASERNGNGSPVEALAGLRTDLGGGGVDATWAALVAHGDALALQRLRLLPGARPNAPAAREWIHPKLHGKPREGTHRFQVQVPASEAGPGGVIEVERRPLRRSFPAADDLFAALLQEHLLSSPRREQQLGADYPRGRGGIQL